jgi:hypothetical protein
MLPRSQGYFQYGKFGCRAVTARSVPFFHEVPTAFSHLKEASGSSHTRKQPSLSQCVWSNEFNMSSLDSIDFASSTNLPKKYNCLSTPFDTALFTRPDAYTAQDVQRSFKSLYTTPILPQYQILVTDMMMTMHLQSTDAEFRYDPIYAFGICTQFYSIMRNYALEEEVDAIFYALLSSLRFHPQQLLTDAQRIMSLLQNAQAIAEEDFWPSLLTLISTSTSSRSAKYPITKYTDAWGIGLVRMMELRKVEVNKSTLWNWCKKFQSNSLLQNRLHDFPEQILQTWSHFLSQQQSLQEGSSLEYLQRMLSLRNLQAASANSAPAGYKYSNLSRG